jgi:hypothetical protein
MPKAFLRQDAAATPVMLTVNGKSFTAPANTEFDLPDLFVDAARNSGFDFVIEDADDDAPDTATADEGTGTPNPQALEGDGGTGEGGGTPLAGGTFDPEAIIKGKVEDVVAALAGLTPEQLDAVAAAEGDREVPRAGVKAGIEKAKEALAATSAAAS